MSPNGVEGAPIRVLTPEDILLRALRNRGQLDDPRAAFYLRANEKNSGLSVNFDMTADQCRAQKCFNKTYGVRSIRVESVLALELAVQADAPTHANIRGIPYTDDDPKKAEYLAGKLAEASLLISEGLVTNPAV